MWCLCHHNQPVHRCAGAPLEGLEMDGIMCPRLHQSECDEVDILHDDPLDDVGDGHQEDIAHGVPAEGGVFCAVSRARR